MIPDNIEKAIVRMGDKQVIIERGDRIRVDDPAPNGSETKTIRQALNALKAAIREFAGLPEAAPGDMEAHGYGSVYTIHVDDSDVSLFTHA